MLLLLESLINGLELSSPYSGNDYRYNDRLALQFFNFFRRSVELWLQYTVESVITKEPLCHQNVQFITYKRIYRTLLIVNALSSASSFPK